MLHDMLSGGIPGRQSEGAVLCMFAAPSHSMALQRAAQALDAHAVHRDVIASSNDYHGVHLIFRSYHDAIDDTGRCNEEMCASNCSHTVQPRHGDHVLFDMLGLIIIVHDGNICYQSSHIWLWLCSTCAVDCVGNFAPTTGTGSMVTYNSVPGKYMLTPVVEPVLWNSGR
jgi:hypothetical protein